MTPFALGVRAIAAYNQARFLRLSVEGARHLPASGPAIVAARHYHHLFDGAALVMGLARQPHVFVALDWTASPWERLLMETVCNLADWPVTLRERDSARAGAFAAHERGRYVRRSIDQAARVLARGDVLAIFPEGRPTIDPHGSNKRDDEILPFARGILGIAAAAEQRIGASVPIVPAGLRYRALDARRYDVLVRLGPAYRAPPRRERDAWLEALRDRIGELSLPDGDSRTHRRPDPARLLGGDVASDLPSGPLVGDDRA